MPVTKKEDDLEELTIGEAARRLGVSPDSGYVNRLIRTGVLPARRHGARGYRVCAADLERLRNGAALSPHKKPAAGAEDQSDERESLTAGEAARRLNVTPGRVYQMLVTTAEEGGLAGERRGGAWEIKAGAVADYGGRRRRAGRPAASEGEWISQSVAADIYGRLRGRKVSRQAIHDLIRKGRLEAREVDGVRLVSRRAVMALAEQA